MLQCENEFFGRIRIEESGELSGEAAWLVTLVEPDTGGAEAVRSAVQAWAGKPGDALKVPTASGTNYTLSTLCVVTRIDLEPVGHQRCRVTFTYRQTQTAAAEEESSSAASESGSDSASGSTSSSASASASASASSGGSESSSSNSVITTPPVVSTVTETRSADGILRRKGLWRQPAASAMWPAVGSSFYWSDGFFLCESCEFSTGIDLIAKGWVTAREVSTLALGPLEKEVDAEGVSVTRGRWYVANTVLSAFLANHAVGTAASWAGTNFFHTGVSFRNATQLGSEVSVTARQISTRKLYASSSSELTGYTESGSAICDTTTTAIYQVKNSDLSSFLNLVGTTSLAWTGAEGVIVKVKPKMISAWESRVEVESVPALRAAALYRSLGESAETVNGSRITAADMVRFYVTAAMAGYRVDADGRWNRMPGWVAGEQCPLVTTEPLPKRFCESVLKCLTLTETTYLAGSVASHVSDLASWARSRVYTGSVGGLSGSYLKLRQSVSESLDQSGSVRTKIVRTYELSPLNYSWNAAYWASF